MAIGGGDDEDSKQKRRAKALLLAERLWMRERGDISKTADFHACYQSCLDTFPALYQQVGDFLNSPETQAWIEWSTPATAWLRTTNIEKIWTLDDLWIAVSEKRDYEEIWEKIDKLWQLTLDGFSLYTTVGFTLDGFSLYTTVGFTLDGV